MRLLFALLCLCLLVPATASAKPARKAVKGDCISEAKARIQEAAEVCYDIANSLEKEGGPREGIATWKAASYLCAQASELSVDKRAKLVNETAKSAGDHARKNMSIVMYDSELRGMSSLEFYTAIMRDLVQPLATSGGSEAESAKDAERRIPGTLRHRERLVSVAADFMELDCVQDIHLPDPKPTARKRPGRAK